MRSWLSKNRHVYWLLGLIALALAILFVYMGLVCLVFSKLDVHRAQRAAAG